LTGFFRVIVAIGGGWLALRLTGWINWLFAALTFGLIVYGVALTAHRHFLRIRDIPRSKLHSRESRYC
jgi:hypothetical protein